jgi:gluconokinase
MDVVVGLDSGTTATKAVAVASDATVRAMASSGYSLNVPSPGWAELDPDDLRRAAVEALTEVAAKVADAGDRVVALSLCAAMHGLVPMDDDGATRGPLLTWADGRAGEQARLIAAGSAGRLHERTGTPVHPMSPLAKLAWWRDSDPDGFAATPRWGGVKELLVATLCEAPLSIDLSLASCTGLYDVHARRWDAEALELAGVHERQLADVRPTTDIIRGLRAEVANATGLPVDLPVVIGASDGTLANLGVGAITPGVAAVSLGTSGAIRAVRREPAVDPAHRLFCYALTEDRWVLGGAVNNAGSVVRWAAQAFGAAPPDADGEQLDAVDGRLLEDAAQIPPGSEGLLCLPYLLGERAPWWQPGLHGAYLGLRRDHGRPHLVRAAVEGVCQQLALVRRALNEAGAGVREVRATGGALESPVWRYVLSAALDLPVGIAKSPEGTGTGAALLGFHALGVIDDLDTVPDLIAVDDGAAPDPGAVRTYQRLRPLVEQTTRQLMEVFESLDDITSPAPQPDDAAGPAPGGA